MLATTPSYFSNIPLYHYQYLSTRTINIPSDSKQMLPTSHLAPFSHKKYWEIDGTRLPIYPNPSMQQKEIMTSSTKNSSLLYTPLITGKYIWKEHTGHLKYSLITRTFFIFQRQKLSSTDKPNSLSFYHALTSPLYTSPA